MEYSALDIAMYIVTYCYKQKRPISNLKLQKMLYYIWIGYFRRTGRHLFNDEICAWPLGPVVPEVYYEFCSYAGTPIMKDFGEIGIESRDTSIIDEIIDNYIDFSASQLVNRTHRVGGPWDSIYNHGRGNREVIPFPLIERLESAQ